MRNLAVRVARRVYRTLPESWKARYRAARTHRSYLANTRGSAPSEIAELWFRDNKRPVSIVIPSYNDVVLVTEAVASVEATCADVDWEIIIVDDYIDADVISQLRQLESARVRVVEKSERRGFSGTVNVGMQLARYDIVLLNSDIVAQPGWLQALQYSAYAIDPKIGLVSPRLVYPDGRIQYAGTYHARQQAPQWFGHFHVGAPATRPAANVAGYNSSISGACVYITREAFETIGVLDDEYWLGFEDVDYGIRAWRAGLRCYYQPAALLVHHESASRGYSQGHRELASMRRFWNRWETQMLARRLPADADLDIVLGEGADGLWEAYVRALAKEESERRTVRIHRQTVRGHDEALVDMLSQGDRIVMAADFGAAETAWLATVNRGLAAYLLPGMESALHPEDPAVQASILAGYRPEFDYIAPNIWSQRQLQMEAAWAPRARIAPALSPAPLPESAERVVVVVAADPHERSAIDALTLELDFAVEHVDQVTDPETLSGIVLARPRAILSFSRYGSSLVPYALMSCGAVYLSPVDPVLLHEVLDGYNTLQFARGDMPAMLRSLRDALTREDAWSELRRNGHASASRAAGIAGREFGRALGTFSDGVV
jgi:GT2 family glycosyltransferase